MSNQNETTVYIVASKEFNLSKEKLDSFLEFCNVIENFDLVGSKKVINYDGSNFGKSIFMDFDINKEELDKLWKKGHVHRNITLYNWEEESALKEIVNVIQDIVYENTEEKILVDTISLLIGGHSVLSPDCKSLELTSFSLAFLLAEPIKDYETLALSLCRDSQFCDQLATFSEYFEANFSVKIGLS